MCSILSLLKRLNERKKGTKHTQKETTTTKEASCPGQSHTVENGVKSKNVKVFSMFHELSQLRMFLAQHYFRLESK